MARLVEAMDWSATPLGDRAQWAASLRTAASICLASPFASCLAWGSARTQICNDRYRTFCAAPQRPLGADFAAGWPDAWPAMRPAFQQAFAGKTASLERQPVRLRQDSAVRDAVLDFSFVPVPDESGAVGGVLVSVFEPADGVELARVCKDLDTLNYVVSHDIRSPLRTIEEMARIILQDHAAHLPADTRVFLNHFAEGTAKLGERVAALAQFGQTSRQPLARRKVDVGALVGDIIEELRKQTQPRQVTVVVHDLPEVDADPELIRQVFTHTLSNAFKFTRHSERPRIEIGGRRLERQNDYFVTDNGAGFDMKYAGNLFELFARMHGEAQFEGLGIGLALTRRIIERHGGTIRANATRDHGATFSFSLPVSAGSKSDP
jgi:signal transduction histidine kinase